MANRNGRAITFPEDKVRTMGRVATGVRGLKLDDEEDEVIGMVAIHYPGEMNADTAAEDEVIEEEVMEPEPAAPSDSLFGDDDFADEVEETEGEEVISNDNARAALETIDLSVDAAKSILVVSENGFGKRSRFDDFRVQGRGGRGSRSYKVTEKSGKIVGTVSVDETEEIMLISTEGIVIRTTVAGIPVLGRTTSGVKLMNIDKDSTAKVASFTVVNASENDEDLPPITVVDASTAEPEDAEDLIEEAVDEVSEDTEE